MKKSNFVAMIMGTIGGLLLAISMCMCLIPEWDTFKPGVLMGCVGLLELLATIIVWRKMENKAPISLNSKTIFTLLLGIIGSLLLGVGMCLTMVWGKMIFGIIVGIAGIVLLLSLIPIIKGLK